MAVNTFVLAGVLKRVTPKSDKSSALILVQYGPSRERTGNHIDFLNAVLMRVPPYRYAKVKDSLVAGAKVSIVGHLQGVVKYLEGDHSGYVTSELVADRIEIETSFDDEPATGGGDDQGGGD